MKASAVQVLVLTVIGLLAPTAAVQAPGGRRRPPISSHPGLLEETTFLTVKSGSGSYRLEALIVRSAAAKGRLPIALLTHGKPRLPAEMAKIRGPLMAPRGTRPRLSRVSCGRRGPARLRSVGRNTGPGDQRRLCKVRPGGLRQYFAVESDDLEGALRAVAERPDADGTRVIAIGGSVGGGAALALAARNPPGLKAVVNLAGAMRITDAQGKLVCPQDMPIAALASFGSQTKTPTLWIYSENDSNFGPDAARKVHAAYVAQGGVAELKIVPSLQPADGHNVFELPAGTAALARGARSVPARAAAADLERATGEDGDATLQDFREPQPMARRLFLALHAKGPGAGAERRLELLGSHRRTRASAEGRAGRLREGGEDAVPRHHGKFQRGRPVRRLRRATDAVAPLTPLAAPVEASRNSLISACVSLDKSGKQRLENCRTKGSPPRCAKPCRLVSRSLGSIVALLQPMAEHQLHVIERDLGGLAAGAKPGKHAFGVIVGHDRTCSRTGGWRCAPATRRRPKQVTVRVAPPGLRRTV